MAPSSRTTASWARSPGAATQSAFSSRQAIASLSGAIPQGPRLPLLAPTAPRDGVTSAPSQLEQQAVGPRVVSADRSTATGFVTLSQQELAEVLRAAFTSVQAVAPHVQAPDLQAAMASALQGLAPFPPIGAAPSVVPDDELLPPEGFELPPFCSASQGGKGARNDAPSLRAGRPLTELTAGLPSAHIDQWRVRLDGIAREVRDFMSQTGLSHWRVSPQSSVPADPLPSL